MTITTLKTCPNCSSAIHEGDHYCAHCSQASHVHLFSLPHVGHEVMHALTHADKGALHLLKELAIRPGIVAREYILEGKRKKYFNPFTFLILALGITLFVNSIFHPYTGSHTGAPPSSQSATVQQAPSQFDGYRERGMKFQTFLEKRSNLVVFFTIPIFALAYWLFFLRSGINYAEHFVAQVFFSSFNALISLALLAPLRPFLSSSSQFAGLQLLVQLLYLSFAYYQFMDKDRSWRLAKSVLATVLALIIWVVVSYGIGYTYIRYGG
jgi:hypothetical protein